MCSGISTGSPRGLRRDLTGVTQADLATPGRPRTAPRKRSKSSASAPDTDQQPADNCAICAVIALASNVLFATPPLLLLPRRSNFCT